MATAPASAASGKALAGRRDGVFLMTKVCARDRRTALAQLEESLRRLRTDHVDLWQFHECNYDNDPEWLAASGGALEAGLIAKETGKTRYLGFTGHKSPHILRAMLDIDYPWDSCQLPINIFDSLYRSFQREVLPELNRRGIAALGMKSLGGDGQFITAAGLSPEECRRYALSQPITTLVCGMQTLDNLAQDLAIARSFVPMSTPSKPPSASGCAARRPMAGTSGSRARTSSTPNITAISTASRPRRRSALAALGALLGNTPLELQCRWGRAGNCKLPHSAL